MVQREFYCSGLNQYFWPNAWPQREGCDNPIFCRRYEGVTKNGVCHERGVFTYANGDRSYLPDLSLGYIARNCLRLIALHIHLQVA